MAPSPLRETVVRVLVTHGFACKLFRRTEMQGGWQNGRFAAVVTDPSTLRHRRDATASAGKPCPLIAVLNDAAHGDDQAIVASADAFVLRDRVADLLPSIVTLSRDGLSVMPPGVPTLGAPDRAGLPVRPTKRPDRLKRGRAFRPGAELVIRQVAYGRALRTIIKFVPDGAVPDWQGPAKSTGAPGTD